MLNFAKMLIQTNKNDAAIEVCEDIRRVLSSNMRDIDPDIWADIDHDCLGMLIPAYMNSGNKEKGCEYAEELNTLQVKAGMISPEEAEYIFSIMMGVRGQTNRGTRIIETLAFMYNRTIASDVAGKDSPSAIKMATLAALKWQKNGDPMTLNLGEHIMYYCD